MSRQLAEYLGVLTPTPVDGLRRRVPIGGEPDVRQLFSRTGLPFPATRSEPDGVRFESAAGPMPEAELRTLVASQFKKPEE